MYMIKAYWDIIKRYTDKEQIFVIMILELHIAAPVLQISLFVHVLLTYR